MKTGGALSHYSFIAGVFFLLLSMASAQQEMRVSTNGTSSSSGIRAGQTGQGKPFTISVGLREEYDSNINATNTNKQGSFKTIISPDILVKYPMDNTTITARYGFGATYYYDRTGGDSWDFNHDFSLRLNHEFSDRLSLDVRDSFNYSQSPQIGGADTLLVRRSGDGWVNSAGGDVTYAWTPKFSTVTGYHNQINGYSDAQQNFDNEFFQNGISQQFRLAVLPTTTATLGYTYDNLNYTHGVKGYDSHTFTLGADHYILREWLISGSAGGQYVEYQDPIQKSGTNPFASLRSAWFFLPQSSFNLSYNVGTSVTDYASYGSQFRHSVQLSVDHAWTPRLRSSAGLGVQFSAFGQDQSIVNGAGNQNETTIQANLGSSYSVTDWFSVEAGYIYTDVEADVADRQYDRHQVYIGLRGTY